MLRVQQSRERWRHVFPKARGLKFKIKWGFIFP